MEMAATAAQTASLRKAAAGGAVVIAEDRALPVRMRRHLPQIWAGRQAAGSLATLNSTAQPGEHYTFQVMRGQSIAPLDCPTARRFSGGPTFTCEGLYQGFTASDGPAMHCGSRARTAEPPAPKTCDAPPPPPPPPHPP